jgi:TolB protein
MKEATLGEATKTTDRSEITATHAISGAEQRSSWLTRNKNPLVASVLLLVAVVGAISFGAYKFFNPAKELGPVRMQALTTGGKISGEDINGQLSISPDGKYVVCGANDLNQLASLWIRQISTNSLVRLVPAETGAYLSTTFSPDGEQIYYVAQSEKNKFVPTLYRIPVLGGSPTKVLERVSSAIGFSADGKQFAFVRRNQDEMALMIASSDGGSQPKPIATRKQPNGFSTSGPSWSPDGKRIACGIIDGESASVVEIPVDGGEPKPIGSEKWASVGRVIWLADGSGLIMTARPEFSSIGTQVWLLPYPGGQARRITNDLNGYGDVSLGVTSDSNTIATIQQVNVSSIFISAPNEDENRAQQVLRTSLADVVSWTPDGKLVYASRTGENWDIWTSNADGSAARQLTSDAFTDQQPTVSSDGRYIVFQSNRSGARNLWRMDADGTNVKQLTEGKHLDQLPLCTADGRFVIFQSDRSGSSTIWKVGIDGGTPVQVTNRQSESPVISPDGKLIAYFYTDEQANNQPKMSIISVDGGEPVKTIDLPETVQPLSFGWTPDGRSIAYLDNGSGVLNIWSKSIDGGAPKQLTNFKSVLVNSFAISRDNKIAVYRFSATRDVVLIKDFR